MRTTSERRGFAAPAGFVAAKAVSCRELAACAGIVGRRRPALLARAGGRLSCVRAEIVPTEGRASREKVGQRISPTTEKANATPVPSCSDWPLPEKSSHLSWGRERRAEP